MITVTVNGEFGEYKQKMNHGYRVNFTYQCCDFYKDTDWQECPCCRLKPKVWEFSNGRQTACGCGNSKYDHFSVFAESIMSVHKRTGGARMDEYKKDELHKNWDEYCHTMVNPCSHYDLRLLYKW